MFALLLIGSTAAHAQTLSHLAYFTSLTIPGNYVVAGLDLPPQQAHDGTVTGTIEVSGVPQNADIVAAYLYLEMIWTGEPAVLDGLIDQIRFRGQPITARKSQTVALVGPYSPCWSNGGDNMTMLRADVLRLLPPQLDSSDHWTGKQLANHADLLPYQGESQNGNWLLTITVPEAGTGNKTPQVAGASVLIVYRDPAQPLRTIVVNDGLHLQAPGETTLQPIRGFLQSSGVDSRMSLIGGSGSPNDSDQVLFNGSLVANGTNSFTRIGGGTSDRAWSNPTFLLGAHNPTTNPWPVVPPYGEQVSAAITHLSTSPFDCIALAANVFSTTVTDVDHDGLVDRLESETGLKNPAGVDFPNIHDMGAIVGQKDLFVEIGAMKTLTSMTQGSTTPPYQGVVPVPIHDHMPSPSVLATVIDALRDAGMSPHIDVGDARGVAYRGQLSAQQATAIIVGDTLARGGESLAETYCVVDADTPECAFPLFPGTVSWNMGYQYLVQSPVGPNGEELTAAQQRACRSSAPPAGCGRRRFDSIREGIFHYLLYAHARGVRKSTFPCLLAAVPVAYGDANAKTCPAGASPNPEYSIPKSVSGMSQSPGHYGMISLGLWDNFVGTEFMQASTTVHELAHSVGVRHGGAAPTFIPAGNGRVDRFEEPNCKPFYFSVTNYLYQAAGVRANDGMPRVRLSTGVFGLLNGQIDETNLFDGRVDPVPPYRAGWYAPLAPGTLGVIRGLPAATKHCDGSPLLRDGDGNLTEPATARLDAAASGSLIDWRGDGGTTTGGSQDVNFDGRQSGAAAVLSGFDDRSGAALDQLGAGRNMAWFSSGLDLGGLDLGGLDLGGLDLGGLDLGGLDLGGLDLGGLDLGGLDLGGLDLGGLDLGGLDLGGLDLGGLDLGGLDLGGLDLGGAELDRGTVIESGGQATSPNGFTACVLGGSGSSDGNPGYPACASGIVPLHRHRLDWLEPNVGPVNYYQARRVWDPTGTAVAPAAGNTVVDVNTTANGSIRQVTDTEELPHAKRFIYWARAFIDGAFRAPSDYAVVTAENVAPTTALASLSYTMPFGAASLQANVATSNPISDVDSAQWVVVLRTNVPAGQGTLILNSNGSFTYTPNGFVGATSFTYVVNNGPWSRDTTVPLSPDSNPVTVTIDVPAAYGFVNVQNLPPPAGKTFKRGSNVTMKWRFTVGGTPVNSAGAGPIVRITGPNGVATYSEQEPGHSTFKGPSGTNGWTWQFNWQTIDERTQQALPAGTYTVTIYSTLTGQTFPTTGTIAITLVK